MRTLRKTVYAGCCVIAAAVLLYAGKAACDPGIKLSSPPLPARALEGLGPTDIASLEAGRIVVLKQDSGEGKGKQSYIRASLVFNQPIDKVWDLLKHTERQEEYLPHLKASDLITVSTTSNVTEFLLKIMFFNIRYRVDHTFDNKDYRLSWHLDPGYDNGLKELEGYYNLYAIDGTHTLARYGSKVDVGSLVPEFVEDYLTRKDLPKALGNLKAWVDSDGKFRKTGD